MYRVQIRQIFAVLAVVLVCPTLAAADGICIVIDTARDNLSPTEQKALNTLLLDAFEDEKQVVDRSGKACTETYTVHHVRLGKSINVAVSGPKGKRKIRTHNVEELPLHYSQIVRSLLSGKPISNDSGAVTRKNVDTDKMSPRRAAADSLWYVRLGYAAIPAKGYNGGPVFGFGYRFELDKMGVDVSFANMVIATYDEGTVNPIVDTEGGLSGSWIRLMVLYFSDPVSNNTLYFGGGLSWGGILIRDEHDDGSDAEHYTGSGLQAELTVGYELFRASTIRLTTSFEATLPFYMAKHRFEADNAESVYAPTFSIVMGVGWGKGNRAIRVIH